jgi:hypothetical protein
MSPKLSKSFWNSVEYLSPDQTIVIAPVKEEYPISKKVMVKPLHLFIEEMESD